MTDTKNMAEIRLERLLRKAGCIGVFQGTSTTTKWIPSWLAYQIQEALKEVDAIGSAK